MTRLQAFLDKCKEFKLRTDPTEDYNNWGSTGHIEIEFPDHSKFYLRASTEWTEPCIDVD